jgi:hypothetical protein
MTRICGDESGHFMQPIRIAVGDLSIDGELNDTECARALARVLPLTAEFRVWGDELHFDVPLEDELVVRPDKSVSVGDLGFWAEGRTLCIFFGPTPMSAGEEPVSAVPVTVVGRLQRVEELRTRKGAGEITMLARNGREG